MPSRPVSPCVNVCVIGQDGYCNGCRRTLEEIARWASMTALQQWETIRSLEERWALARERPEFLPGQTG
ncbi:MAG: DUF1289 domain-containing protein [Steroidobacteraceae bacterium]